MAGRRVIAVFGSSAPRPGERAYAEAVELGRLLGQRGFDVVNGGHDGTMEAVSRGGQSTGARVIGVTTPAIRAARGARVNACVDDVIDAANLVERITVMMRRASGVVVLPGGTGTLAELALVWEHVDKRLISPRPVICLGSFWQPVVSLVSAQQPSAGAVVRFIPTAEAVVGVLDREAIDVSPEDARYTGSPDRGSL